jgi:hypothetical protein
MWLTAEEIAALTGKQRQSAQRRVLAALGVPYKVRPDGTIVVSRSAAEAALHAPAKDRPAPPRLRLSQTRRVLPRQERPVDKAFG